MDFQLKKHYEISDLREIMRILRSENGCPWDREQTHASMRKNLIEETYEAVEAIDLQDTALLREELGDVLLQVMFHSQMEEEAGSFCFEDVVDELCQKLITRHPHVFSNVQADSVDEVLSNWEAIKENSKGQTTAGETLTSVAQSLPALMRCEKVQGRAKKANPVFGYADVSAMLKDLHSEVEEAEEAIGKGDLPQIEEELGDVLFSAVNLARNYHLDPGELLTRSTDKFIARFCAVEKMVLDEGKTMKDADEALLDRCWKAAKAAEKLNSRG